MKGLVKMLGTVCVCFIVLLGGGIVVVSLLFDKMEKGLFRLLYGKDQ